MVLTMKPREPRGPKGPQPPDSFDRSEFADLFEKKARELGLPPNASSDDIRQALRTRDGLSPTPEIHVDSVDDIDAALEMVQGGAVERIQEASTYPANDNDLRRPR
jgi:hypothetical protein